jgi:general secretion pathway protein N
MTAQRMLLSTATGLFAVSAIALSAFAAISTNDVPDDAASRPSIDVELYPTKPTPTKPAPARPAPTKLTPTQLSPTKPEWATSGNPLWGVPLGSLSATRERPIFSASRRGPAPVASVPRSAPVKPVVRPPEPEHLNLTLVGTVVSQAESIGVFLDQSTNIFVRLRAGEEHSGWIVRSIKGREASLEKNSRTETLSLPAPRDASPRAVGNPE